jgi:integrase
VAAARAKEIYLFLHTNGWEATLAKYRPKATVVLKNATIGEFLARPEQRADLDAGTFADYARALRKIVADIIGASADARKFGYRGARPQGLAGKVHAFKLAELTPAKIQAWKRAFLATKNADEKAQRHAKVSVNSFLRRARSPFSEKVLRHLEVTCSNPFEGVEFEPRQSLRYRSQVNIEELVVAAREQLSEQEPNAFKVLLLAAFAGLRRAEIDTLSWKAFRWNEHTIRIEPTRHYRLKTETSAADVAIDEELLALFGGYHARAQSEFVIEVPERPIERRPAVQPQPTDARKSSTP